MSPADQPTHDPFIPFPSRRSVVHSTRGIAATPNPYATEVALDILRRGGNAADAGVAAAAVLNLVDPSMTGIGGDAFALYYEASSKQVHAINGSGRSPANVTIDDVCRDLGIEDREAGVIPTRSGHAVTVPGAAGCWLDLVERFGSGKECLGSVLAPAIKLANEGVVISEIASHCWVSAEDELRQVPNGTDLMKPDPNAPGAFRAPRSGEFYRNPLLAKTFRALAEQGRKGFYEGPVAEAVVEAVQSAAGRLDLDDLKRHGETGSEVTEAIPFRVPAYDGDIDLWEHGPNCQGIVAQIALGVMQGLEEDGKIAKFGPSDHNSAAYLHALIFALRQAFSVGTSQISDPSITTLNPASLLTSSFLSSLTASFTPSRAVPSPSSPPKTSDTIYLSITDSWGNGLSLVNSIADNFGSRIIPAGTGFVLQSRGAGFHLHPPTHPNIFAPDKRPYNTIIPAITTHADTGELHAVLGVMGGAMQPQGHVQVLLNMVRFGMNPQLALDAPRICVGVALPGKSTAADARKKVDECVYVEEGVEAEVVRELEGMGYEIKVVKGMGRSLFGRGQVIRVAKDPVGGERVYSAGSDGRGDGYAAPLV